MIENFLLEYTIFYLVPEFILCGLIIFNLLSLLYNSNDNEQAAKINTFVTICGFIFIFIVLTILTRYPITMAYFNYSIFITEQYLTQKWYISLITVVLLIVIYFYINNEAKYLYKETPLFISISVFGMMLLISSVNLFFMVLAIELQVLPYYILTALKKYSNYTLEASLKYLLYSCYSSLIIFIGLSLIFYSEGTLHILELNQIVFLGRNILSPFRIKVTEALLNAKLECQFAWFINLIPAEWQDYKLLLSIIDRTDEMYILIGVVFIIFGLLFKLGVFPFHTWVPDIYEGTSNVITLMFIILPKLTIIHMFDKLLFFTFAGFLPILQNIFLVIGILSIIVGACKALYVYKLTNLMAYSTIVHMGYITVLFSITTGASTTFIYNYLLTYILSSLTLVYIWLSIKTKFMKNRNYIDISELNQLKSTDPVVFICLLITLCALAGLPPFAAFYLKLSVYTGVIRFGHDYLVIILIIALSVLTVLYYFKIIRTMVVEKPINNLDHWDPTPVPFKNTLIILFLVFLNIFFMFFCETFMSTGILALISSITKFLGWW